MNKDERWLTKKIRCYGHIRNVARGGWGNDCGNPSWVWNTVAFEKRHWTLSPQRNDLGFLQ